MQGVDFPLITNNSNMTNVLQKSTAVTIAFFDMAWAISWGTAKPRHIARIKHCNHTSQ